MVAAIRFSGILIAEGNRAEQAQANQTVLAYANQHYKKDNPQAFHVVETDHVANEKERYQVAYAWGQDHAGSLSRYKNFALANPTHLGIQSPPLKDETAPENAEALNKLRKAIINHFLRNRSDRAVYQARYVTPLLLKKIDERDQVVTRLRKNTTKLLGTLVGGSLLMFILTPLIWIAGVPAMAWYGWKISRNVKQFKTLTKEIMNIAPPVIIEGVTPTSA